MHGRRPRLEQAGCSIPTLRMRRPHPFDRGKRALTGGNALNVSRHISWFLSVSRTRRARSTIPPHPQRRAIHYPARPPSIPPRTVNPTDTSRATGHDSLRRRHSAVRTNIERWNRCHWQPSILPERGIHFGTVAPPDVGQRPTFGPESPLLWESSTLTVARSARRPTAVPKWIPLLPDMRYLFGELRPLASSTIGEPVRSGRVGAHVRSQRCDWSRQASGTRLRHGSSLCCATRRGGSQCRAGRGRYGWHSRATSRKLWMPRPNSSPSVLNSATLLIPSFGSCARNEVNPS